MFNILESVCAVSLNNSILSERLFKEIIVIDDGSSDNTAALVQQFASRHPEGKSISLLRLDRNYGKGRAIREGLKIASGDIIIIQDADLEYDPEENFPILLAPFFDKRQADVVYGSRFLAPASVRPIYFWHLLGNRFLTFLTNLCTGLILTDMETGYKVFRRSVVQELTPILKSDDFCIEPELTIKIAHRQWRIFEVPITYTSRTYEEGKKIGWRDGLKAIVTIIKCTVWDR
ncbi:MAG: Glycosyltransferase [Parcubacteria group bacterium GW2011_GWA2_46_9]|nr:MAG: Glycosyltransferase [Parcubacteria group bacterium GW2011_GWA2_46_9]